MRLEVIKIPPEGRIVPNKEGLGHTGCVWGHLWQRPLADWNVLSYNSLT